MPMSINEYSLADVKDLLYEIIDTYIAILQGDVDRIIIRSKKCIRRFRESYLNGYKLSGSYARVRIKGRLIVGYICSSGTHFPFSEAVWWWLHCYRMTHTSEYFEDHPREVKDFADIEAKCINEVDEIIANKPIEACGDIHRLKESFDMMIHLAHLGPLDRTKPELSFDPATSFLQGEWFKINPWRLPRGKSMLIDYWYNIPMNLRSIGHMVLDRLASSEIKTVEDLLKLKSEVEKWNPDADKGSSS